MLKTIEALSMLCGTSGDEYEVAEYIIKDIGANAEVSKDALGNVMAFKKGKKSAKNKVVVCAHMDEVGLIITGANSDGRLSFSCVGGIIPSVIIGRQVLVGKDKIPGVIGTKAVHQQNAEEKENIIPTEKLSIDIGAKDKDDALKYISLGDRAVFCSDFIRFGDGKIKAKALDDRMGCGIMLEMLKNELEYDTYFVFTVQEEVGARGARAVANALDPDYAIVLETTTACDIDGVSDNERVCSLGNGVVVSYMDHGTVYDRTLFALANELAKERGISVQTKTAVAGGNDSGAIHTASDGVKTVALSAPCRYLHSPSCVLQISDIEATKMLTEALAEKLAVL